MEGNRNSEEDGNQRFYQSSMPASATDTNPALDGNNAELGGNQNVSLEDPNADMIMEYDQVESCRLFGMSYFFIRFSVEYFVASFVTLLAIQWQALREFVEQEHLRFRLFLFILLLIYVVHYLWAKEVTTMVGKYRHCFQLLRMLCLTGFFIDFAIYPTSEFDSLSVYWIVIGGSIITVTLVVCALLTGAQKVQSKGWGLWLYSLAPPLIILLLSQLFYFMMDVDYANFITDMCAGIILSLLFSSIFINSFQNYVNSPKFEQLIAKSEHLSSFINYMSRRNLII